MNVSIVRLLRLNILILYVQKHLNPVLPEFFSSVSEIWPKIACFRLPTHRRGAHRNFFYYPFLFQNRNFGRTCTIYSDRYATKG